MEKVHREIHRLLLKPCKCNFDDSLIRIHSNGYFTCFRFLFKHSDTQLLRLRILPDKDIHYSALYKILS
ncbi:hypothetical protein VNO78_28272 [Psophocarpus tetragonolobus]|uniref:Uncharacterized protein n=1 Tax=Psophocarpus tetragonolobus TaxID=3891 RepID=A0AAN9S1A8_PSOTE